MRFLRMMLAPKEVRAALGVLDEARCHRAFEVGAFEMVRREVEDVVLADPAGLVAVVRRGTSPREWVYCAIANIAFDYVVSAEYHVWRGALNPIGEDLVRVFNGAGRELVRMGACDDKAWEEQQTMLWRCIREVG